jgi:hypothetical protein
MMGVQYANLTMATAVSGRLTHTIPWDVLSLRRAGEEICRHDLPITVGRKPRRFWSVRPSVALPHAPGLSHSLPADKYCIGVRLDWAIHQHRYRRPTRVGGGSECGFLALPGMQKSYNAGSRKTCVQRFSHQPKSP